MGRKKKQVNEAVIYEHWIYHVYHLANGNAFERECRVCNFICNNKDTLGTLDPEFIYDVKFFNEAIKSNERTVSIMDRISKEKGAKICQKNLSSKNLQRNLGGV